MPRLSWLLFFVLGCVGTRGEDASFLAPYQNSEPVTINGVQFVATTEKKWRPGPIMIALSITSLAERNIDFPLFDSFKINIRTESGKPVEYHGGRDKTFHVPPALLEPGTAYSIKHKAQLTRSGPATLELEYEDGTGYIFVWHLVPGKYRLSFSVHHSLEEAAKEEKALGRMPVWSGHGQTKEVAFEIPPAS